jgi:hypothetical protein
MPRDCRFSDAEGDCFQKTTSGTTGLTYAIEQYAKDGWNPFANSMALPPRRVRFVDCCYCQLQHLALMKEQSDCGRE